MTKRDFLAVEDWSVDEIEALFQLAARLKRGEVKGGLERKVLAMVFLDPSLRTRTSFEAAMFLHGGHAVVLEPGKGSWALETEDGVATITITEEETGTTESMSRAANWVQQNLESREQLGSPEVTTGQVLMSATR